VVKRFLNKGAFDLTIDSRVFWGGFTGDEHGLIVNPDGAINLTPETPTGSGIMVPAMNTTAFKIVV
jgi:hypothetical protein